MTTNDHRGFLEEHSSATSEKSGAERISKYVSMISESSFLT